MITIHGAEPARELEQLRQPRIHAFMEGNHAYEGMALYLASFDAEVDAAHEIDLDGELFALSSSLYLVRSCLSQSKIYHRLKWQLPPDTALIVATLSQPPKFKGMAAGALKWVRSGRI